MPAGSSQRLSYLATAGCALLLVGVSWLWRRLPVDDAYITFRYARNLASGEGLVFNPGEWVLGTTSALWAALLSLCPLVGLEIEQAAVLGGGLIAAASIALFLTCIARTSGLKALVWAAIIALYYPLSVVTFSGMETAAYSFVVGAGLLQFSRGRLGLGALLALAATLLRPDGVLVIITGLLFAHAVPLRSRLKALAGYSLMLAPFLLFSYTTYGSVLPHSVEAKRLLYAVPIWKNALFFLEALSQSPLDSVLLCAGAAGLLFAARERDLQIFVAWGALYSLGIIASGIKPVFFWYFGPLWLLLLTVGIEGLRRGFKDALPAARQRLLTPALATITLAAIGLDIAQRAPGLDPAEVRESAYRQAIGEAGAEIQPNDLVLMSEIGILGYGLPQARVLDSAGIVSPQVSAIIAAAHKELGRSFEIADGCPWLPTLLARFAPTWIIGARDQLSLSKLEQDPAFTSSYSIVGEWEKGAFGGVVVYRRRLP